MIPTSLSNHSGKCLPNVAIGLLFDRGYVVEAKRRLPVSVRMMQIKNLSLDVQRQQYDLNDKRAALIV